ncbi:MAG TPA: hypothetical protein VLB44_22985 [Kofleriaceae bacterium]|nr:hypothetical protein [Kofleriaceae bacterium]
MRIGELLVEQRKLRQSELTRALADKPAEKRLCSFLITKGLVDFDDAARALGEQRRVACALSKHLVGRDPALAKLLPAELGRSSCALPIGRSSNGNVIVCVREPAPALLAALERAIKAPITMVITPATRLEMLVRDAYGEAPVDEFDIDFSSSVDDNPIPTPPPKHVPAPAPSRPARAQTGPVAPPSPPLPDMTALDPESVRLALTDLDDARVDKDFSQSGQLPVPAAPAVASPAIARTAKKSANTDPKATRRMSVEMMQVGLEHATTREAATDLVLAYVATRWISALVLAIRDKTAIGYRGHGVIAPESLSIPIGAPSTVQHAIDSRFVSMQIASGPAQDELAHALEGAEHPIAAPVSVKGQPVAVLVVGDPIDGESSLEEAAADLAVLAEALGAAYQRILGR